MRRHLRARFGKINLLDALGSKSGAAIGKRLGRKRQWVLDQQATQQPCIALLAWQISNASDMATMTNEKFSRSRLSIVQKHERVQTFDLDPWYSW